MTDLLAQNIKEIIKEQFTNNPQIIEKSIFSNCNDLMSKDEIYSKMIINSIELSVNMSVQIIVELLLKSNVIVPADEELLRRQILSVLKD